MVGRRAEWVQRGGGKGEVCDLGAVVLVDEHRARRFPVGKVHCGNSERYDTWVGPSEEVVEGRPDRYEKWATIRSCIGVDVADAMDHEKQCSCRTVQAGGGVMGRGRKAAGENWGAAAYMLGDAPAQILNAKERVGGACDNV
ncbi:hypothetical protein BDN70DRAFT_901586 [Pholiota conissans]|uniref:Uncharacterized protein n=1 Tax=Pholiota conissans TaxID=109636 RepID=A0A9P5YLS1_9AGAR|nr:hypothetical protein BDN70DRAFT_901586 [Pholiota conissans]